MRYLIIILASLMFVGCAKQSALNSFNNEPNNKAIVTTIDGGWGHSVGQISQELAIVGAFYECETRNLLYFC